METISPMFLLSGDPFLDWILLSSGPAYVSAPEVHEVDQFIDHMLHSVVFFTNSVELSSYHESVTPEVLVDTGVSLLATEKDSGEIPQLAHQIQKYGDSLLHDAHTGSVEHQVARRLTEMDTKTIEQHAKLPFGNKNCCLRKAFEQQMVSEKCAQSILLLENTFSLETEFSRYEEASAKKLLVWMTSYFLVLTIFWASVASARRRRNILKRVIASVYTNPSIRKQVELDIGESISLHTKDSSSGFLRERTKKNVTVSEKDVLPSKTISCEGVSLQVV